MRLHRARKTTLLLDLMLRVDLTALDDGLHEMELTPSPADLDLDPDLDPDPPPPTPPTETTRVSQVDGSGGIR